MMKADVDDVPDDSLRLKIKKVKKKVRIEERRLDLSVLDHLMLV